MISLKEKNAALNKLWKIFRQYAELSGLSNDACDRWIDETRDIWWEAKEDPLVQDLVNAFTKDLERIHNEADYEK